jgi:hypothetical protein
MNVTDIESRIADYRGRHARGEVTTLAHDIALIDAPALLAALTRAEHERDEARAMAGQLRQAVEQARLLVSGCVATWQDMVDELAQCDPESYALPDQFATDHALRRAEIALRAALSAPAPLPAEKGTDECSG